MSEFEFVNPFENLTADEAAELAASLSRLAQLERLRILEEKGDTARREEHLQKVSEAAAWEGYLKPGYTRASVEAATAELEALQNVDFAKQTVAQRRRRGELRDFLNKATKGAADRAKEREDAWRSGDWRKK